MTEMKKIRRYAAKIHNALLCIYDWLTATECEISVGDIILKRTGIDHCQFLLSSRKLDVKAFMVNHDKSFHFCIIYKKEHKEEEGNLLFSNLIESYIAKGYDSNSLLTVDKDCRLIDGNHRMGINLYMGINRLNVRFLKRKSPFTPNLDTYLKLGLSTSYLEEVCNEFDNIQNWLIETGNTFCCFLSGKYENGQDSLLKDLRLITNVLDSKFVRGPEQDCMGVLVQFSLDNPSYCVKNGKLYSIRAEEIERALNLRKNRIGLDADIKVSKSCLEGKEMWVDFQSLIIS